jgi:hypothetical protein
MQDGVYRIAGSPDVQNKPCRIGGGPGQIIEIVVLKMDQLPSPDKTKRGPAQFGGPTSIIIPRNFALDGKVRPAFVRQFAAMVARSAEIPLVSSNAPIFSLSPSTANGLAMTCMRGFNFYRYRRSAGLRMSSSVPPGDRLSLIGRGSSRSQSRTCRKAVIMRADARVLPVFFTRQSGLRRWRIFHSAACMELGLHGIVCASGSVKRLNRGEPSKCAGR